jgi:hypothetical protein
MFTAFFNTRKDPLWWQGSKNENWSCGVYLRNLYLSVRHLNITMVIFHDGGCSHFAFDASTKWISFVYVTPRNNTTPNDFRFIAILEWLEKEPFVEWIYIVDGRDVIINRDPFPYMIGHFSESNSTLFVSPDSPAQLKNNGFVRKQAIECMSKETAMPTFPWTNSYALMCGVWGGTRDHSMCVLRCMATRIMQLRSDALCDMGIFAVCVALECAHFVHCDTDHSLVNPMRDCRGPILDSVKGPVMVHNKCRIFMKTPCLHIDQRGKYSMRKGENGTAQGCRDVTCLQ